MYTYSMSFWRRQYDRARTVISRRARPVQDQPVQDQYVPTNMSPKKETAEKIVNQTLNYVRSIDPDTPTLVGYRKWIEVHGGDPDVKRLYSDQFMVAFAQRVHKQRVIQHLPENRQHDAVMYDLKHMFVKNTAALGYLKRTRRNRKSRNKK